MRSDPKWQFRTDEARFKIHQRSRYKIKVGQRMVSAIWSRIKEWVRLADTGVWWKHSVVYEFEACCECCYSEQLEWESHHASFIFWKRTWMFYIEMQVLYSVPKKRQTTLWKWDLEGTITSFWIQWIVNRRCVGTVVGHTTGRKSVSSRRIIFENRAKGSNKRGRKQKFCQNLARAAKGFCIFIL